MWKESPILLHIFVTLIPHNKNKEYKAKYNYKTKLLFKVASISTLHFSDHKHSLVTGKNYS